LKSNQTRENYSDFSNSVGPPHGAAWTAPPPPLPDDTEIPSSIIAINDRPDDVTDDAKQDDQEMRAKLMRAAFDLGMREECRQRPCDKRIPFIFGKWIRVR
jgi:hypothetical protein